MQRNYYSHDAYMMNLPPNQKELAAIVINIMLLLLLFFSVGCLSGWQGYYLFTNTTTIEVMENDKIEALVDDGSIPEDVTFLF